MFIIDDARSALALTQAMMRRTEGDDDDHDDDAEKRSVKSNVYLPLFIH